jgi:hypothetical protein
MLRVQGKIESRFRLLHNTMLRSLDAAIVCAVGLEVSKYLIQRTRKTLQNYGSPSEIPQNF